MSRLRWTTPALLLVLAACSSAGHSAAAPKTTTTTNPTTTTSTSAPAPSTTTTTTALAAPVPAADAAGLAAQVADAERAARNPATTADALARAGWTAQVVYRTLAADPALTSEVVKRVPADLKPTVEANARAGAELRALTAPRTALPQWRIVAPAPEAELLADYKAAEHDIGVPWPYLAAIHFIETKFGRVRGTSTAGAEGPMQFKPATWQRYGNGGDINNNRDAIFAAARLLKADGFPNDVDGALYHYNPSAHYVTAVKHYAERMQADEAALRGFYNWQVYYRMVGGDRVLLGGYPDVPPL